MRRWRGALEIRQRPSGGAAAPTRLDSGSLKDLGTGVIKSDGEVLGFDDYSLTRPRHAAVVALDRVVAVIFTQRTLDAIGRRDAHVLSTIVRAAASSGHDQL